MLVEGFRNTHRSLRHFHIGFILLGRFLNPPLNLADVVRVFTQARPVSASQPALQLAHVLHDGIENTVVLRLAIQSLLSAAAIAEQLLEHYLRTVLHGLRQRRRSRRNRIAISATIA